VSTTLYLRSGETASATANPALGTLPSGYLAAWDQSISGNAGSGAVFLDSNSASSQLSFTKTWSSIAKGATNSLGHAQYCSNALTAQTITSGNWTIAFASDFNTTGLSVNAYASLYLVNGSTGAIRTTIFALAQLTGSGALSSGGGEKTNWSSTCSGSSATATDGDYLVLEIGLSCHNGSNGALTPSTHCYDSGATAITTDQASTSDAKSSLGAPVTLTFKTPTSSFPFTFRKPRWRRSAPRPPKRKRVFRRPDSFFPFRRSLTPLQKAWRAKPWMAKRPKGRRLHVHNPLALFTRKRRKAQASFRRKKRPWFDWNLHAALFLDPSLFGRKRRRKQSPRQPRRKRPRLIPGGFDPTLARKRPKKPSKGIRRRLRFVTTFRPSDPPPACPTFTVIEALQASALVVEQLFAVESVIEPLSAAGSVMERLSAVITTQEPLSATARIVPCAVG
jgi:hypothetical protein